MSIMGLAALGVGIGNMFYNMHGNERTHKYNEKVHQDFLKQQQYANHIAEEQLYRGTQIKRADMEAAGFHPTLALGAAPTHVSPPVGSGNSRHNQQVDASSIMQGALVQSQIAYQKANTNLINAQAKKVEQEIEFKPREYGLQWNHYTILRDLYAGNLSNAAERLTLDNQRLQHDKSVHREKMDLELRFENLKRLQISANITKTDIDSLAKLMETQFMDTHGLKMPTGINNMYEAAHFVGRTLGGVWQTYNGKMFVKAYLEIARRFVTEGEREAIQRDFMNNTGDRAP